MKKIFLYGLIILIVFNLLSKLWNSINLDEEEEVLKFSQKVEMLKSSKDYSDIRYTSKQYLSFLEENIDWFSPEQSKQLSDDLNSLIYFSETKIDSIEQVETENRLKKEEEEKRIELEKANKLKAEKKTKEKKTKEKKLSKSTKPVKSQNVVDKKREEELCSYGLQKETILKTQLELNNGRKLYGAIYDFQGEKVSDCKYIWFVQFSTPSGSIQDAGFRTSYNKNKGKISVELYDSSAGSFGSPVYVNPPY